MTQPAIKALAPWFGCARMLAPEVGKLLAGCRWVGVPFAGGMPELAYIDAPTIVVGDVHRHVMNLAAVVATTKCRRRLSAHLSRMPFHPDVLALAQTHCEEMERGGWTFETADAELSERWALNYFIVSWMGRSGKAGTVDEFKGALPIRWNANGGDSNTRYRSAVGSLRAWHRILRRCNFATIDVFEFLAKVQDLDGHGLYCDPPFPETGLPYKHKFTEEDHRGLAKALGAFQKVRIVCRFYDHPLVRELYPETRWRWRPFTGRKQSNAEAPEVLLVNSRSCEAKDKTLF
ncbi:MAG: hypothetical protein JW809_19450 [Pirellulales bacterium]|nr:hypothetical protein [Pirellulales bacterium]